MKHLRLFSFIASAAVFCTITQAQAPTVTVDPSQHGNLAAAQDDIVQAYSRITQAQRDNDSHLAGHAQRAKELLMQANQEIEYAAEQANTNEDVHPSSMASPPSQQASMAEAAPASMAPAPPPAPPQNLSGSWTIFADNTNQPGSSLKQIQITQDGNIISGYFRGPHQKGHLQGWINGTHVEFSTDTRDVLTFRGEITADGMSGLYGAHGVHAPWKAQRQ